jgi:hypothetical protein
LNHDDDVEYWRKEKTEAGYSEHSEKDGGAEGLPYFFAGAAAENQREDTKNEGE